ncbi:hypothetical protein LTR78_005435 [Recurvomyces mirabilis]|uniref:Uncharacterized protein n=1 Tax=Recurvomyces mirabilis TaxID=574656 RepID=A0AAE1C1L9_9PEZI|nr:hypothetical protein LTR78_005435 [Recurvomyces mirabilis]
MAISTKPETLAFVIGLSAISQTENAFHTPEGQHAGSRSPQYSGDTESRLTSEIKDLRAVNNQLHKTIECVQSSEALVARDQKIARLEGDKRSLTAEVTAERRASTRAKALQATSDDVATRILAADESVRKAAANASMLKTQNDRAQKLARSLEAARGMLREERDELEGASRRLSGGFAMAKAKIEDLETENEELRMRVVELEDRNEEAEWSKLKSVQIPELVRPARPGLTVNTNHANDESEEEL